MPPSRGPPSARPDPSRTGNRLLDLLPKADLARVLERAVRVTMPAGETVVEAGEASRFAHFPIDCALSAVIPLRDGSSAEAATVGNEGMAGIDLVTDRPTSVYRMICQVEGESLRLPAEAFRGLLAGSAPQSDLLKRYTQTVVHQSGRNAACNLRHEVGERMCRWLLMTHDRAVRDEFYLTQEFLGVMLGVRRQSVGHTAAGLQGAGLIRYVRGRMTILDRPGLEAASCECYEATREMYRRVMGTPGG